MVIDVEPEGGDPPCWAHLFEDEWQDGEEPPITASGSDGNGDEWLGGEGLAITASGPDGDDADLVDLVAVARMATAQGAIWTRQSEDLDVNLLQFAAGEGVAEHVKTEVAVGLVSSTGKGVIIVFGAFHGLHAGHALVIPKG